MRRASVLALVLVAVLVALPTVGRPVARLGAQDATPAAGAGIVGSWRITVAANDPTMGRPPGPALATFFADGTMMGSGPPVVLLPSWAPFPKAIVSAGHGVWEATGPQSVAYTFELLMSEEGGTAYAVITISGTGELDASGDAFASDYSVTVVGQIRGLLATATGTLSGERIAVEPMATPMSETPAVATPAA